MTENSKEKEKKKRERRTKENNPQHFQYYSWWKRDTDARPRHNKICVACGYTTSLTFAWQRHIEGEKHNERHKTIEHRRLWELGLPPLIQQKDCQPMALSLTDHLHFVESVLAEKLFDNTVPSALINKVIDSRMKHCIKNEDDYFTMKKWCEPLYNMLEKTPRPIVWDKPSVQKLNTYCEICKKQLAGRRNYLKHCKTARHLRLTEFHNADIDTDDNTSKSEMVKNLRSSEMSIVILRRLDKLDISIDKLDKLELDIAEIKADIKKL